MSSKISFILDGKTVSIDFNREKRYTPTTTVLNYLRSLPGHKGTKEGCAEGDCGACTVVLASLEKDKQIKYMAVDSCLLFLPMLHGKQLITIENLRSPDNDLHPVQKSLIKFHGSQCGFCTPGIVMSVFALYKQKSIPGRQRIEEALSGNLCRCTGYLPIINAAIDVCKGKRKDYFSSTESEVINRLRSIKEKSLSLKGSNQRYFIPNFVKESLKLRIKYPKALLISGATDVALRVTKNHEKLTNIIDLSSVTELKGIFRNKHHTKIMAGTTLSQIKTYSKKNLPTLHKMLVVFGSEQIRNMATIGGNLATASPIGDIAPVLMSLNSEIVLISKKKKRKLTIEEFITGYRKTACRKDELIYAILIPNAKKNSHFAFYKFSKREDLDISTVSAGFRLQFAKNSYVDSITLAFGGLASRTKRAKKTEKFLKNKEWNQDIVVNAGMILEKEFTPISDARASAAGRILAAKNLLLKFWSETKNG